jgi:hypothetical protein
MRAPETIARAGDDGDASVKPDCHENNFLDLGFFVMPGLVPGIHAFFFGCRTSNKT